eukprot:COSAG06_NODE_603_length_13880_cov_3.287352_9_plen_187_part_00
MFATGTRELSCIGWHSFAGTCWYTVPCWSFSSATWPPVSTWQGSHRSVSWLRSTNRGSGARQNERGSANGRAGSLDRVCYRPATSAYRNHTHESASTKSIPSSAMTSPGCEPPTAPQAAGSVEAYSAYSAPRSRQRRGLQRLQRPGCVRQSRLQPGPGGGHDHEHVARRRLAPANAPTSLQSCVFS